MPPINTKALRQLLEQTEGVLPDDRSRLLKDISCGTIPEELTKHVAENIDAFFEDLEETQQVMETTAVEAEAEKKSVHEVEQKITDAFLTSVEAVVKKHTDAVQNIETSMDAQLKEHAAKRDAEEITKIYQNLENPQGGV